MTNTNFITRTLSDPDRPLGDRALDDQRNTSQLLAWMGVEPGMTVADLMAGTGYTIEVLSRAVGPGGRAYAIQPRALQNIEVVNKLWHARLKRYDDQQLVSIDGEDLTSLPQIPDGSVDIVVSYLGYHDTSWMGIDRARMNRELLRILKPSGFYVIADHCAAPGRGDLDAATLHRIEKSTVQAELAEVGFALYDESDMLSVADDTGDWNASPTGGRSGRSDRFLMRFVKADSPLREHAPAAAPAAVRAATQGDDDGEKFDAEAIDVFAASFGVVIGKETLDRLALGQPGYTMAKARRFVELQHRIDDELLQHPLIRQNPYMEWFQRGEMSLAQLRSFVVQLSVFANSFVLAMLKRMIESGTLIQMRATKEILLNELGVSYRPSPAGGGQAVEVSTSLGTVDGGTFHHDTAHLEWLVDLGRVLGLEYEDLGRPHHGTEGTRHLSNELFRLYGSGDEQVAMAANYIVKQVGFAGIWSQALEGLQHYNARRDTRPVPLDFFQWQTRAESLRAENVQATLEEYFFSLDLNEDRFIQAGKEMLEAFAMFWNDLDQERRQLA